jgi:glycosyltransferase involved in cell wall biosynthesis
MNEQSKPDLDVTVVMPAFNRAGLIVRALDSVRNQTRRPCQIIVVDDGSSDATVVTARAWGERHDFPILVEVMAVNGGPAAARNRGIALASSRYVAFLDSDDEHLPATLETLVAALDAAPDAVLSFGDGTIVTPTNSYPKSLFRIRVDLDRVSSYIGTDALPLYRLHNATNTMLKASIIPTSATCFRRDVAMAVGGMPTSFRSGEDWLFWLRLAGQGNFVFVLNDLALHYRHDANLTLYGSEERIVREKLKALTQLRDGSLMIALDAEQRRNVEALIREQIREWRFHLSKCGLPAYLRGLRGAESFTGDSTFAHLLSDTRSVARATLASLSIRFLT